MKASNVIQLKEEDAGEIRDEIPGVESGGAPPHDPGMDNIGERLARVESGLDWIKVILTLVGTLIIVVMIGGITFLGVQFVRLDGKIDAIPQRLSEEFRAMRAEMATQTSAIANSITAARQTQPPTPPQIIVIPEPLPRAPQQPEPNPTPPKP
jgi:hypothetical protein